MHWHSHLRSFLIVATRQFKTGTDCLKSYNWDDSVATHLKKLDVSNLALKS